MLLGVPLGLIVVYAVYRMNEYYMLRRLRAMMAAPPGVFLRRGQAVLGFFLFPARIFGWAFLLYFGFRNGWLKPVVLLASAFPLSLLFQAMALFLLRRCPADLDTVMTTLGFAVLPACAILMFLLLPPT